MYIAIRQVLGVEATCNVRNSINQLNFKYSIS